MKNINKTSIISFGLMLCILMPKLELFSIPGYHQGIRYDDLFLLTGIDFAFVILIFNVNELLQCFKKLFNV